MFCMPLFSGHGYDEAFAQNMAQVIEALKRGETFRLCQTSDVLCAACPNHTPQGGCSLGEEDVLSKDAAALKALRLSPGEICDWPQLAERLRSITREGFCHVCGECRWKKEQLCTYELLRGRLFQEAGGLSAE